MPRYRFRWEYLDDELLTTLLPAPELDRTQRAAALRAQVGARPSTAFVAERWPDLRDQWMPRAPEARGRVVVELRARRVGDVTIDTSTEAGQLAYLKSCRNAPTLRAVVLAELIRAGESAPPSHAPLRRQPTWPELTDALAATLAAMVADQYLIIVVKGTGVEAGPDDTIGSAYFVQFAAGGPEGVRAEAVSNSYLAGSERLDEEQQRRMVELGWRAPTRGPEPVEAAAENAGGDAAEVEAEGSPNYFAEWAHPVPFADVASLAIRTFAEVFRVAHPGFLHYEAFKEGGDPLTLPDLPLETRPVARTHDVEPAWMRPEDVDDLRAAVQAVLREFLNDASVEADDDGDFGLRVGSVVIYIRAMPDMPVLRLFSHVLTDVRWSPSLLSALNDLNRDHVFVSAFFAADSVVLAADLYASPFIPEHLAGALKAFAAIADEYDDVLLDRFGGRVASGATARRDLDRGGYL